MIVPAWSRRDTATLVAFAVASTLYRIPFRATSIFHGDSYGLAMGALFTWTAHPPGFIGYCTLVRLTNYLVGDITRSFVLVSIVCTAIATAAAFAIGRTMFGFPVGVITALFYGTSLDVSYFSEVALTYAAEGAFATLAALTGWLALSRRSSGWLVTHSAILAIGGSVRQTTLAFLFPLWLFVLWRSTSRWRDRFAATGVLVALVLCWSIPNARNVRRYWPQGNVGYLQSVYDLQVRMGQYYDSSSFGRVEYEATQRRFHWPLVELGVGLWNVVSPPAADAPIEVRNASISNALRMLRYQTAKVVAYSILACGIWIGFIPFGVRKLGHDPALFLGLWIIPAWLFFVLNHFGAWGYLLILLAGFAVIAARGLLVAVKSERRAMAVAAVIALLHATVFMVMRPLPETSDRAKIANVAVLQYAAPAIRASFARARSSAFTEDPRQVNQDCVTDECLRQSIPRDFRLPGDAEAMKPLF